MTSRPIWDEPYACVGGKGVRSTPNLTELEPGYTVLSLASWPSSSSIPDRTDKSQSQPQPQPQQPASRGYVALDAATSLPPPVIPPVDPSKHGYVTHPPSSLLWEHPEPAKGYVKTGTKEAFTPECDGSWEEPFGAQLQRLQPNSGSYVKAGECGIRPSRTEPALGSGYVMTGDSALLRDRHKPEHIPPVTSPQTLELFKQGHEYVMTGDRVARNPPLLMLDPDPPKAYCRVSERDTPLVRPMPASSGYVPHRQLETRNTPSVVE